MPSATRRVCRTNLPGTRLAFGRLSCPNRMSIHIFLTAVWPIRAGDGVRCERNSEVSLPQLLHLNNGEDVIDRMRSPDGRLATDTQRKRPMTCWPPKKSSSPPSAACPTSEET